MNKMAPKQKESYFRLSYDYWMEWKTRPDEEKSPLERLGCYVNVFSMMENRLRVLYWTSSFYEGFESDLTKQPYLLGTQISLLDIAWFIYTHRLFLSGYPFKKLHPKVLQWYKHLLNKKEFNKEVKEPIILKAVRSVTRVQDKIAGTVLRKISNL